jgi:NAD(P)-dependent dehydrogenase (short-subunit alcohol dehydrogenase family)
LFSDTFEQEQAMGLGIKGKRALITGGSGGMGIETIKRFIEAGVTATATDLKDEDLEPVRKELGIGCIAGDLPSKAGLDDFIAKTGTDFDIWVHAAGVTGDKGDPLQMSQEAWENALNIDFLSGVRMARPLCPAMIDRG